jgi:hypothetical protein
MELANSLDIEWSMKTFCLIWCLVLVLFSLHV